MTDGDPETRVREALVVLSPAQAIAVNALVAGSSHVSAAEAAGVTSETVSRWFRHYPACRAALTAYRNAIFT